MKKNIIILFLFSVFLFSCSFWEKTAEEKIEENFKNELEAIKEDIYNTPIWTKDFSDKVNNIDNNIWKALEKSMYEFQINQLIEEWDDLTIPRDIMYNISIFDNTKDTSDIEKQLIDKWFRIWEKQDVFWMIMFYVYKVHPVDVDIIAKDEIELNSITNVEWLSYDWWSTEIAKK